MMSTRDIDRQTQQKIKDAIDRIYQARDRALRALDEVTDTEGAKLVGVCTDEYRVAFESNADRWVPGAGGHETPFRDRAGRTLLWCWNPAQRRHAYIDTGSDLEVSGPDEG